MKKIILSAFVLILAIGFFSCNKETNSIGLGLLDDQLGTDFSDTTTLVAYSEKEDSLLTLQANNLLGVLNDPVFGQTKSSIYTKILLKSTSTNFGTAPVIDSLVLTLAYSGYYGDTTQQIPIRVYRLTDPISSSPSYYQFSTIAHEATNLNYNPTFQTAFYPKTQVKIVRDSVITLSP
ncbi:MAG: DUF4270 domain-containing protein, partial [Bacteroidales bacterium]|nr:DUF4270 domain-containing protein [Bacteroidales bacterium]